MSGPDKETIEGFATILIEQADNPNVFKTLLGCFLSAAREVALDDALNALRKRHGRTCYRAVEELKKELGS